MEALGDECVSGAVGGDEGEVDCGGAGGVEKGASGWEGILGGIFVHVLGENHVPH